MRKFLQFLDNHPVVYTILMTLRDVLILITSCLVIAFLLFAKETPIASVIDVDKNLSHLSGVEGGCDA